MHPRADPLVTLTGLGPIGYDQARSDCRSYQADSGLVADGILGPQTRGALIADEAATHISDLRDFFGSFGLLIRMEGYAGYPYWPGQNSGVTLDYGWDLSNGREEMLEPLYGELWSPERMAELHTAFGLRGRQAHDWVRDHDVYRWPVSRESAARALPQAAVPYWREIASVCPQVIQAPYSVQTALLSIAYNIWIGPIIQLQAAIQRGDWMTVSEGIRGAQGSPSRRKLEAALIRSAAGPSTHGRP